MNSESEVVSQKLSKHELQMLSDFLIEHKLIPLVELHGFLTAVISSPDYTEPVEWIDALNILEIEFGSHEEGEKIHSLLANLYFEIIESFETHTFLPVISCDRDENLETIEELLEVYGRWAYGYLDAIRWDEKAWDIDNANEITPFINLISTLVAKDDELFKALEEQRKDFTPLQLRMHVITNLSSMVMNIYDYWHDNNSQENQPIVHPTKIGRNDPCPCESGKKYKKCCGMPDEVLH